MDSSKSQIHEDFAQLLGDANEVKNLLLNSDDQSEDGLEDDFLLEGGIGSEPLIDFDLENLPSPKFVALSPAVLREINKATSRVNPAPIQTTTHRIPKFVAVPVHLVKGDREPIVEKRELVFKDHDMVFVYPTSTTHWVGTPEAVFCQTYRGAEGASRKGLTGNALASPVLEYLEEQTGGKQHINQTNLAVELQKVVQAGMMYKDKVFIVPDMSFNGYCPDYLKEILFDIRIYPDNILLNSQWEQVIQYQKKRRTKARLAVSGSAVGVSDQFVIDEIKEEISFIRDSGFDDVEVVFFTINNRPLSRGEMRVSNSAIRMKSINGCETIRFILDHEKLGHEFCYHIGYEALSTLATHSLHFDSGENHLSDVLAQKCKFRRVDLRTLEIQPDKK